MKRIMNLITHRLFLVALFLIIQILVLVILTLSFESYGIYFYLFFEFVGLLFLIQIINSSINPSYKLAWIIPILTIPIFGSLFYLLFGRKSSKCTDKRTIEINNKTKKYLIQNEEILEEVKNENLDAYNQINYLSSYVGFPVYKNTTVKYLKSGEEYYKFLIQELKKAKKYIFLEYFIIQEGKMWNGILEILKEKVSEGVDVRLIYDDIGCIVTLPSGYYKYLNSIGIKTHSFNKFIPVLNGKLNNRDHRKIAVIDGIVGFTGGINLADEYINEKERFGYWKDNGVMLKGEAVWSLTTMFLSIWDYIYDKKEDYNNYKPSIKNYKTDGFITPYSDSPLDSENTGENVYLNLINKAKKYIYITTPYLIIDSELEQSLKQASKNGVDVRIVLPYIADKKTVNELTKAYYQNLLEAGIKIYEYLPGFVHAKTIIVDDIYASIGTINFDYRSLFLHFECSVLMYNNSSIEEIKKDFNELFKDSKRIFLKDTKISVFKSLKRAILRLFAPLM